MRRIKIKEQNVEETIVRPENNKKEKQDSMPKRQPPFNVILLNDDDHTVEYVVLLCQKVFGYPVEKGVQIAAEVHVTKRCILWTGSLELAELKQSQIHSLGKDELVDRCQGSMTAILEPAA